MLARTRVRTGLVAVVVLGAVLSLSGTAAAAPPKRTPAPTVSVSPATTNQSSATFTFSDSNATATFACSFDGSAYAACTSPRTYTGLGVGTHTLTVRATVAGWRPGSASQQVVVDRTAPAAPGVAGIPTGATRSPVAPTFSSAATDLAGFRCSVDGGAYAACTSGAPIDSAPDGLHTVAVTAVDVAGNVSPATRATWIRDTYVAAPFVTSSPASPTTDTAATIHYASHETDATFLCSLDASAFAACPTTGVHYSGLAVGTHTFVVRAQDTAGNTADSSVLTWVVEAPAPNLVSATWTDPSGLPAAVASSTSATFAFQTSNSTGETCQVDAAPAAACSSPLQLDGLSEGQHLVVVYAAGTGGPVALAYTWSVDSTPPESPAVLGPPSRTSATSVSALVIPSHLDDVVTCTLDGAAAPCPLGTPVAAAGLADGPHSIVAVETDRAGNTSSATATWTVDTVAPTYAVTTPTSTSGSALVTFSEDMAAAAASPALVLASGATIATVRTCAAVDGSATPCDGSAVRSVALRAAKALVPGQYYAVTVNAVGADAVTDAAGNPAASGTTSFRAPVAVQENDAATGQTWRRLTSSLAKGGSYVLQTTPGARATWSFSGTSVVAYLMRGPSFGYAAVYVDGRAVGSWNTYASRAGLLAKPLYGLSSGSHTITVAVTGKRGARMATGAAVGVDAFADGRALSATPALATSWRRAAYTGSSGGAQAFSGLAGTAFTLPFRGTTITWSHATGPAMGIAAVYVDGVKKASVDLWSSTARANVVWRLTGLTDAQHTVQILTTGTKRAASKGTLVSVDRLLTS